MKRKKQHAKSLVSMLALMLTLSAGTVFPGVGTEGDGTVPPSPKSPPVEENIPDPDLEGDIKPLTDLEDDTTKITKD